MNIDNSGPGATDSPKTTKICMRHMGSADGEETTEALVTTGQALKNLVMVKAALKQAGQH